MNTLFAISTLALAVALSGCLGDSSSSSNRGTEPGATPEAPELSPASLSMSPLGRYETGVYGLSAAEIPVYDHVNQQIFVVNARSGAVDVLDALLPGDLTFTDTLSMDDLDGISPGSTVNSIAFHDDGKDGLLAVAIENAVKTDMGYAALYNARTLEPLSLVEVGAQPDNLTFTPDGAYLLTANEGEPSVEYNYNATGDEPESVKEVYRVDPEGSISVITVVDGTLGAVRTAGFERFEDSKAELIAEGVRIFGPADNRQPYSAANIASVTRDLEPEYLAVSSDSRTAWVSLQENNALARLDIASATVTDIFPLGYKDHGLAVNALDVSDGDRAPETVEIAIQARPGLVGMYHPDSIAAYEVDGRTYIITANEGDARAWGEEFGGPFGDDNSNDPYFTGDPTHRHTGFIEEWRVKHLVHDKGFDRRAGDDLPMHLRDLAAGALLDPNVFGYCGAAAGDSSAGTLATSGACRDDFTGMGRLLVSWVDGYKKSADGTPLLHNQYGEVDPAGDRLMYEKLYAFGGRSFAIWDGDTGEQVFDSGAHMEHFMANQHALASAIVPNLNDIQCLLGSDRSIPCDQYFNSNHSHGASMDRRSVNKGPEPEGVVVGAMGDKRYAFIGIERMGGAMAYDVSNPREPVFVDYFNTRDNWELKPEGNLDVVGDLGAEGLFFVPAAQSPNEEPLLIIGHEVSGSTTVFQLDREYD